MVHKDSLKIKVQRLRRKGILLAVVISVLALQIVLVRNANAEPLAHRIAGDTQYETSSAIAKEGWTHSDYAVLAYGGNFPDALASAPLAKKYNAPILLTEKENLTPITKQTLQDLQVKNVVIVGGPAVVSSTVESQLKEIGISVNRLAGRDKYDTAIEIAKQLGVVQEISVVTGDDYADALSISSVSALQNAPIILAPKDYLTDSIKNYVSSINIAHTYLVGNADQISESVANQFPNVERITGVDKYTRNVAVLKRFDIDLDFSEIFIATGNGFADALAGSAYATSKSSPIVLVDNVYDNNTATYLDSKKSTIKQLNILGGEVVVPSTIVQKYTNILIDDNSPSSIYTSHEIAQKFSPSVVYIEVSDSNGIPIASGSGFVVDSNGKIATNYQLIKGAYSAKVKTYDGKIYDVSKVFTYDSKQDLALIKIDATGLQPAPMGDSDKIGTGDRIYTIGNPSGMDDTMSDGIISTKSKIVDGASYIQISALISSGTSGGVLVDEHAEVIGITTANVTNGQNLNLAIPINLLKPMLTQDINTKLAQLPRESVPTQLTKKTDSEFAAYLNSQYCVMTIAGKSVHFNWKVNDYQTGSSDISIHGMMDSTDYGNWMEILNANGRGSIMFFFANINNDIAENYPGKSFVGSVLYQDYYSYLASPQFPYNDVTYYGDGKWLVKHIIVSFYDLHKLNTSDPRVTVSD